MNKPVPKTCIKLTSKRNYQHDECEWTEAFNHKMLQLTSKFLLLLLPLSLSESQPWPLENNKFAPICVTNILCGSCVLLPSLVFPACFFFFFPHLQVDCRVIDGTANKQFITYWYMVSHLSMKEGSLFVLFCFVWFVLMRSIKPRCFRPCSWSLWKALEKEGCIGLVSWRLDLQCKSS